MFARSSEARSPRKIAVLIAIACGVAIGGTVAGISLSHSARIVTTIPSASAAPVEHRSTPLSPVGLIAAIRTTTAAYRFPGGPSSKPVAHAWYGAPLFLPVIAIRDGDLEVRLPTRPNGSTTWIARGAVSLYRTPYRIVVDLGTRHLLLYRDGKVVLDAPAGIGTIADPTPTGHFFVAFFAKAPSAAWGPFLLVTSAHSNTINNWEQSGDAIVAIHGPIGQSAAIGSAGAQISHGCVRLQITDLAQLRAVPDGSPVDIISG